MAAQCPVRSLLLERAQMDDEFKEEIHEATGNANDSNEDVFPTSRCLNVTFKDDD